MVVRAMKRLFGSDSSKSTIFGPEVDNAIEFTFLPDVAAILANSNMATIRLDVNHRYKTVIDTVNVCMGEPRVFSVSLTSPKSFPMISCSTCVT